MQNADITKLCGLEQGDKTAKQIGRNGILADFQRFIFHQMCRKLQEKRTRLIVSVCPFPLIYYVSIIVYFSLSFVIYCYLSVVFMGYAA